MRIEALAELIPPSWNMGSDPMTDEVVDRIIAIESEWYIKPEDLERFTSIVEQE